MTKVEIVQMGPLATGLNLKKITRVANKGQKHFQFVLGDRISRIGEPNTEGAYKVTDLAKLLDARRIQECADIAVGIVDSPLYWGLFSGVDMASNNVVVSTAEPADSLLSRENKSKAAYVLVETAAQLLTIEYRRLMEVSVEPEDCELPWHKETKPCLFDYCDDPLQTVKKLITPDPCPECVALLSANIRDSVFKACVNLAKRAVRPRFLYQLRAVFSNPIVGFIFIVGSLLVVEGLAKLGVDRFWASLFLLIPLALVIIIIFIRNMWRSRHDRL